MIKRVLLAIAIPLLWASTVFGFTGPGSIWAQPKGSFTLQYYDGDTTGFGRARDACIRRGGGVITLGPGLENLTLTFPTNANLLIIKQFTTGFSTYPPLSGGGGSGAGISAVVAMRFGDPVGLPFDSTQVGIQAALDYVGANSGVVILGAKTFTTTSALWIHSNTHLIGQGIGISVIKRSTSPVGLPNDNGNIICTSKIGANGTPNTALSGGFPSDSLANISISDLTLDGNYTAFPSVNPNGPNNFGIRLFYVDHVLVNNVEVKNTLQTGLDFFGCRNGTISNIWTKKTGQQINLGTRNGINFNMDGNVSLTASTIWGKDFTVNNIHLENHKDTGFFIGNVSNVKISNVFDFCNHDSIYGNTTFEVGCSGADISGYVIKGIDISNVEAVGTTNAFWSNSVQSPGLGMEDISITNCTAKFSTEHHFGTAMNIISSAGSGYVRKFTLTGCSFTNINSGNNDGSGVTAGFLWAFGGGGVYSSDIKISHCTFVGAQGGTLHTNNDGFRVGGSIYKVTLEDNTVRNVESIGYNIVAGTTDNTRMVSLNNCLVDGAQSWGYAVETSGGTVNGVNIKNCIAKDTNKNTLGPSFYLLTYSSGQVLKNIRVEDCSLIRTSGTNMRGLFIQKDVSATVDSIFVINNEFSKAVSFPYNITGSPTNLFISDFMGLLINSGATFSRLSAVDSLRVTGPAIIGSISGTTSTLDIGTGGSGSTGARLNIDSEASGTPYLAFQRNVSTKGDIQVLPSAFRIEADTTITWGRVSGTTFAVWAPGTGNTCKFRFGDNVLPTHGLEIATDATIGDTLRVAGRVDLNNSLLLRQGADIVSAATIAIGDANFYNLTGANTVTDITGPSVPTKKLQKIAFYITGALQITNGNHWILNGNFNGNGVGGKDVLVIDWDGTNATEDHRTINP